MNEENELTKFEKVIIWISVIAGCAFVAFGTPSVLIGYRLINGEWLSFNEMWGAIHRKYAEKEYGKDGLAMIEGFYEAYCKGGSQ